MRLLMCVYVDHDYLNVHMWLAQNSFIMLTINKVHYNVAKSMSDMQLDGAPGGGSISRRSL